MLSIENLIVGTSLADEAQQQTHKKKCIVNQLNLQLPAGEVHVIMGPNGAGKSTLVKSLAGDPEYTVRSGKVSWQGQNLLEMSPEQRAHAGVFLGFQDPVEIEGVNNMYFLRQAYNAQRRARGEAEADAVDFLALIKNYMQQLDMDQRYKKRGVNAGFSGGEKKRNEILQMLVLQPSLALLDETDSGLDIDALQVIARGINSMRHSERSILLVTHYQRLLNYIKPDRVHVMLDGKIVKSGDASLALALEKQGYAWLQQAAAQSEDIG